jgi:hypothetical protein
MTVHYCNVHLEPSPAVQLGRNKLMHNTAAQLVPRTAAQLAPRTAAQLVPRTTAPLIRQAAAQIVLSCCAATTKASWASGTNLNRATGTKPCCAFWYRDLFHIFTNKPDRKTDIDACWLVPSRTTWLVPSPAVGQWVIDIRMSRNWQELPRYYSPANSEAKTWLIM